jgi:predicted small secreted protein
MNLKTCVIALALTLAPTVLAACNTVEGVGKDVTAVGGAVTGAAKDAKK